MITKHSHVVAKPNPTMGKIISHHHHDNRNTTHRFCHLPTKVKLSYQILLNIITPYVLQYYNPFGLPRHVNKANFNTKNKVMCIGKKNA